MHKILEFIFNELKSGRSVVSAAIVSSSGSTPRSTGARMALASDMRIQGTVGGGPGEALTLREAKKVQQTPKNKLLQLDLSGNEAANAGMICGGEQEILIEHLQANEENLKIFNQLLQNLKTGKGGVLYTAFISYAQEVSVICRALDFYTLKASLPTSLLEEVSKRAEKISLPFAVSEHEYTVLVEPVTSKSIVYIAGAGHVGEATAHLASFSGFMTIVLDDRSEFLSVKRFPDAGKLHKISEFNECFKDLEVSPEDFIVILTRGHVHDKTVLAQALHTSARYIGMIGSRKKRDAIYKALLDEGFAQKDLDRVHSPIGLSIGADTPEEIAVSIVAELIQKQARLN